MSSKKSNKEFSTEVTEKPKRTLNPIIKAMNDYRNNVIAEHVGSKAPRKTSPVFKLTLAAARTEMGLDDKDKNTIEVVNKAQTIFEANVSKYLKMAEVAQSEEASTKTEKPKKETKAKSSKKEVKETKTKSKSKKVVEEVVAEDSVDEESEEEVEQVKTKSKAKGKSAKKKEIVVDSDSDSDSDSD